MPYDHVKEATLAGALNPPRLADCFVAAYPENPHALPDGNVRSNMEKLISELIFNLNVNKEILYYINAKLKGEYPVEQEIASDASLISQLERAVRYTREIHNELSTLRTTITGE